MDWVGGVVVCVLVIAVITFLGLSIVSFLIKRWIRYMISLYKSELLQIDKNRVRSGRVYGKGN